MTSCLRRHLLHPCKKLCVLMALLFMFFPKGNAQDSCSLQISLLTCAPGAELYSTFGHTAIRVADTVSGLDEVYNYGTFEFSPQFYSQFVMGKLLYALSVQSFADFMYQYQAESRSVQQQTLNLTCIQKSNLYGALQLNAHEANRFYRYDFLFDNCTTRAKNMLAFKSGPVVKFNDILGASSPTFRNLIYVYLNRGHHDWSKLGIDLLLGAKMDRKATNEEAMFLPDNLLKGINVAQVEGRPILKEKKTILDLPSVNNQSLLITPLVAFGLLLVMVIALTVTNKAWAKKAITIFDFLFFFVLGCVGLLLLFMWFGTDHALCANNYNLLWALPSNTVMAFFVHTKRKRVAQYFGVIFWLTVLLLGGWFFLPQQMNPAFIPLVIIVALRSRQLSLNKKYADK